MVQKELDWLRGYSMDELVAAMGGVVTKQALSKYERDQSRQGAGNRGHAACRSRADRGADLRLPEESAVGQEGDGTD